MHARKGKNNGAIQTYYLTITGGTDITGKKLRYYRTVHVKGKRELEKEMRKFERDVEDGKCSTRKRCNHTLLSMCEYVYDKYFAVSLKQTTLRGYKTIMQRISTFPISNAKASVIKAVDIQEFIKDMQSPKFGRGDGYSPKTIKSTISFISDCYEQIIGEIEGIYANPCKHVKLPKAVKPNKRTLSAQELPIFIQNLETLDPDTRVMFELALFLGLRRSEALGLKYSNVHDDFIDLSETRHNVEGETVLQDTKTTRSQALIALPKFLADELQELKKYHESEKERLGNAYDGSSDFVILSPDGKEIHPSRPNDRLHAYVARIGIAPISYHELRHTYASLINHFGADLPELASQMRHSSPTVSLSIYTHMLESVSDSSKKFASKIENFYSEHSN